jgi:hypothetical protein
MTQNVIQLPQEMYEAVRRRAAAERKTADRLVTEWVAAQLDEEVSEEDKPTVFEGANEHEEAIEREQAAYLALHPMLLDQHPGEYVAIHGGKLIDCDKDGATLSRRVRSRYPQQFVWISRVEPTPIRTFRNPSFRFTKENE